MEYDRALYRVYERVMEDLNASPPLIPRSSSSSVSLPSSLPSTPTTAAQAGGAGGGGATSPAAAAGAAAAAASSRASAARAALITTPSLPLFLPLKLAATVDVIIEAMYSGNFDGIVRHVWSTFRGLMNSNGNNSGSENGGDQDLDGRGQVRPGPGGILRRRGRFGRRALHVRLPTTDEEEGGSGAGGVGDPISGSPLGLRRRSPIRANEDSGGSGSDGSSGSAGGASNTFSSSSNGGSSSDDEDDDDDDDDSSLDDSVMSNDNDDEEVPSSSAAAATTSDTATDGSTISPGGNGPSSSGGTTPRERASALVAMVAARNQRRRNRIGRAAARRRRRRSRAQENASETDDGDVPDEGGGGGCTQKGLYRLMRLSMVLGIVHLVILFVLHKTYVGAGVQKYRGGAFWRHDNVFDNDDAVKTCIEYALATRPPEERGEYFRKYGDGDGSDDEDEDDKKKKTEEEETNQNRQVKDDGEHDEKGADGGELSPKHQKMSSDKKKEGAGNNETKEKPDPVDPPLLGKDEILQIKILYGGKCAGQCSRVHKVRATNSTNKHDDDDDGLLRQRKEYGYGWFHRGMETTDTAAANDAAGDNNNNVADDGKNNEYPDKLDTPSFWKEPHYRFSTSEALLYLDPKFATLHNVTLVNVTVTERCLSTGTDHGSASFRTRAGEILSQIFGMDGAIINQLMYGIRSTDGKYRNGYLQCVDTKERWSWRKEFMEGYEPTNFFVWFFSKIGTIGLALISFFLITSITALIVRVLTSSGVVMMFPLFACFRAMGLPGADDRILALSYPWIGRARNAIHRRRIHPVSHLIGSHMAKIFLYYVMYEACQAAWSVVLYGKSIPEALPIWIYGFAMVWEYFAMVFVRSALSVYFFPRIALLYFILYHVYFWSVPYGYFDVALIPLFLFMVQAMLYTILSLEVPAAARGAVSMECPREVYNRLSWPEWTSALPHEWTLFLPVNSRYTPLYDRDVADPTTNAGDSENAEGEPEGDGDRTSNGEEDGSNANRTNAVSSSDRSVPLGSEDWSAENGDSAAGDGNMQGPFAETTSAAPAISSSNRTGLHSRRSAAPH